MMEEDATPARRTLVEQPVLEPLGIAELNAYIGALQAEIARAEASIARKLSQRGAADAVFGRKQ